MSTRDDGGPAFPVAETVIDSSYHQPEFSGMTLRDYFAAKAMSALASSTEGFGTCAQLANDAYMIADAMLKERGRG